MARTPNPDLQEKLAAVKRDAILDAARAVFAEKDFHRATIKDVAARAGVADGTIYNYFENKDALLLGIFDRIAQAAEQGVDPAALLALDLRGFVRAFLERPLTVFQADNFELFRVIVSEILVNRALGERFYAQMLAPMLTGAEAFLRMWGQQNGVEFADLELRLRALSSLMLGLIVQRVLGDEVLTSRWTELPEMLTDLLLEGLTPGKVEVTHT